MIDKYSDEALKDYACIHKGKVRDSYRIDSKSRLLVVSDRVSAFNKKLSTEIEGKGAILNSLTNWWFRQTQNIINNHLILSVAPNKSLVREAQPIRIELVLRKYLTGSLWRAYSQGQRLFFGQELPEGLKKQEAFAQPIITPTTKDDEDLPLHNEQDIFDRGLASPELWAEMKNKALLLFQFGQRVLENQGILLVDTKYEFGLIDGQLFLIDEIHTPDSSRFWDAAQYQQNPEQLYHYDKEYLRQWMLEQKENKGTYPEYISKPIARELKKRYSDLYQKLTGYLQALG